MKRGKGIRVGEGDGEKRRQETRSKDMFKKERMKTEKYEDMVER